MDTMHIDQVHFIGVGGVGMSGIARVAFDQGMRVSGTDLKESRYTKQLREAGIEVHIGHDPANIPEGNPVIVVSTAILDNNPELAAAKARGLTRCSPIWDARSRRSRWPARTAKPPRRPCWPAYWTAWGRIRRSS